MRGRDYMLSNSLKNKTVFVVIFIAGTAFALPNCNPFWLAGLYFGGNTWEQGSILFLNTNFSVSQIQMGQPYSFLRVNSNGSGYEWAVPNTQSNLTEVDPIWNENEYRVDKLEEDFTYLNNSLTSMNISFINNATDLNNKLINISTNLTNLNNDITLLNSSINTLNSSIIALDSKVVSIGNWSFDKPNYTTISYVNSLGNWSSDKPNYATLSYVNSLGNWSGNSSSVARIGSCSANQYVTATTTSGVICNTPTINEIDPLWAANSSSVLYNPGLSQVYGMYFPLTTAATAFTAIGMTLPSVTGTPTASTADSKRKMIQFASAATANSLAGQSGTYTETMYQYQPKYITIIRTDTDITNRRVWVGLTSGALTTVFPNATQTTTTLNFAAAAFQNNASSGDVWKCCSGNGANMQCTNSEMVVKAGTTYTIIIDMSSPTWIRCNITETYTPSNSVEVTRTTLLPSPNATLGIHNGLTTLTAAARNHFIAKGVLMQN